LTVAHHELCFGCGSANLFGLQMELEPTDGRAGAVSGRFFLKQDHQGVEGRAHAGVVASALEEAMALALHSRGAHARARRIEVELHGDPPIGVFVQVEARVGDDLTATAHLREGDSVLAEARGFFTQL
jgi:acyl-coenzyme A thioesterase PaaI-like protein